MMTFRSILLIFEIFRHYFEMRSRLVRTLLIWRREIQSRGREKQEGESEMSRPLTIRWEERDQTWQAPAGEFYVDAQGCRRRREIILRYPHTGLPVARDDREGAWAALVQVLEILIDHPQPIERDVQPIEFEAQPVEREREVQAEARPIQLDAWAKERDLVRECLLSPEPAVELKIEPAVELKGAPKSESKSEPKSKSRYAAAFKGETAPSVVDPGWFDLDQRRDRIIASLVEIIQDPGESSRERLGALNALIRLDKQIRHERHLKGQQDPSEEASALIRNALIRLRESQAARNAAKAAENGSPSST